MWIQKEDENIQGQKNCESQKTPGSCQTLRLRFPKSVRIRTRSDYQRLSRRAARFQGKSVSFDYRQEGSYSPRLGITVSKKYGNAVLRNRFKRVVRAAFRELFPNLAPGFEVNVYPKLGFSKISKNSVLVDFSSLLDILC